MKKVFMLLILLSSIASAATISEWPYFFVTNGNFRALYVIGGEASSLDVISATEISTSLAKFKNVSIEIGTSTIDSEIKNITRHDAIIIGSPCDNTAAFQLLGRPDPCYSGLGGSVGYIKVYEHGGKTQLLITGLTEQDRNEAAKFLADEDLSTLDVYEHIIVTQTNSSVAFFIQDLNVTNTTITNETIVDEIVKVPVATVTVDDPELLEMGEYDPLEDVPRKKSLWDKLWYWISSMFT